RRAATCAARSRSGEGQDQACSDPRGVVAGRSGASKVAGIMAATAIRKQCPARRPSSGAVTARCGATSRELLLARRHALAELLELLVAEELPGAREHLLLLFLGVVLDQFLEHLGPPGELGARRVGLEQVRQHEFVDGAVLLRRLVEHL